MAGKPAPVKIGQKFGELTIIREVDPVCASRKFRCLCSCGVEEDKYLTSIKNGKQDCCSECSKKRRRVDLTGKRFGLLTVVSPSEEDYKHYNPKWNCVCDCGNTLTTGRATLQSGTTNSCGLSCRLKVNPLVHSPTWNSWWQMIQRCRQGRKNYENVSVCKRWEPKLGGTFENFVEDMGIRPEGHTLNRIHCADIYSKETCEWATLSLQGFDKRRSKENTSGRTGVRWEKSRGLWSASIGYEGRTIYLGRFSDFEEACKARDKAELELYGFTKE